uniref:Uncharacterized protein n=3 Tax=viral metagenome TaxID=1070528 RepID=A0A6M3K7D1_9ZZZZ
MARRAPKGGYIWLWRKFRDHRFWPSYSGRRFTECEAWLDLLFDAAFKPHRRIFRGRTFELKSGELVGSQNDWADRWHWKRSEVRKFLDSLYLNGEAMHEDDQNITKLIICGLAGYVDVSPGSRPLPASTSHKKEEEGEKDPSSGLVHDMVQGILDKMGKTKKKG